ncbi:MAG: archease [Candidatus Paceibacterota bacterium]
MKYEILSHPAELRLRIYGKTIEELFINAVEAMAQILSTKTKNLKLPPSPRLRRAGKTKSQKLKTKIKIQSVDVNALLVDFLNEILAKSQINKTVYLVSSIKHQALNKKEYQLEAELTSYPIKRFDEDIKAVTYQDVDIKLKANRWQTELVFDI